MRYIRYVNMGDNKEIIVSYNSVQAGIKDLSELLRIKNYLCNLIHLH